MDLILLIHNEQTEDDLKVLEKSSHSNFRIYQIKLGGKKASTNIKLLINKTRTMMVLSFILKSTFSVCVSLLVDSFILKNKKASDKSN